MINRMLDSNSQVMSAARHQVRTGGMLSLLMAIGCSIFAVWAYFEMEESFLSYFMGLFAAVMFLTGVFRLSRKEQYPQPEVEKT